MVRINLKVKERTPAEMFFQSILDRTSTTRIDIRLPDSICYYDPETKQTNFDYHKKSEYFWVRYYGIWSVLESDFGLDNESITNLIKDMVEQHYNIIPVRINAHG